LMLIKSIWGNIKGVITGALNIIMGAVKFFSGLLTGDFSKMWEGVKQIFKGGIDFAWNLFNLLFVGRIVKSIGSFVKLFATSLKNGWTNAINGIKTFVGNAKNNFKSF
ncbi:phage tail protein, partial [Sutcliffiella cohnii]